MKQTFIKLAVGSMLALGLVASANATIYSIIFTDQSSEISDGGGGANELANIINGYTGTWATLTFNSNTPSFAISADAINSAFGSSAAITSIAFNSTQTTNGTTTLPNTATNVTGTSGFGAGDIDRSTNSLPGTYDFRYFFNNNNNDTLGNGETLGFTLSGFNPTCLTASASACTQTQTGLSANSFALRVSQGSNVSWYSGALISANGAAFAATSVPVPEPESYAMFLAGLALLGFVSRRRKA